MMKLLLLLLLLLVSLIGVGVCSYGLQDCFKNTGDKFAGVIFVIYGIPFMLVLIRTIIAIIKAITM